MDLFLMLHVFLTHICGRCGMKMGGDFFLNETLMDEKICGRASKCDTT
jgi:hypothetical protein